MRAAPRSKRRWARLLVRTLLVLAAIPLVLVPAYLVVAPVSTLMIASWIFGPVQRTWVSLDRIAPALPAAVIMAEDGRFCEHHGVDFTELAKVLDRSRGPNRGASTVTMQTVKNLFLWSQPLTYLRKALEIPIALYADLVWGKRRTMEIYLNVVQWGPGIFGAEAASQAYFKRSARDITPVQAALLVAALPNPIERNPARPDRFLRYRAGTVSSRARMAGGYADCLKP
ncbi:MAG TPA: monofunctional biosynthetic peptidoglycan transglycosylase [Bauldia sp.]|nr:monofunctional biosynthetic peptidoglycan transglycosylase [Bauldia sp.]